MKYQTKMLQNFILLHRPRLSLWKVPERGAVLRGEVFEGGIYNGGRFKCKILIVLISIIRHEQESTLHYCSTVIKSSMVPWDLIFIFSQASQGNNGEQLTGDCKRQEKQSVIIKKCEARFCFPIQEYSSLLHTCLRLQFQIHAFFMFILSKHCLTRSCRHT